MPGSALVDLNPERVRHFHPRLIQVLHMPGAASVDPRFHDTAAADMQGTAVQLVVFFHPFASILAFEPTDF